MDCRQPLATLKVSAWKKAAMSISYSGIVNYGKVTLPSVEQWYTNTNILRDPPKSVTTRRKDRVGETSEITQTLAESGDRFCDNINYYARGVNPMVGVSYNNDNNGNQGGDKGGRQAFLPYRIIREGAFRPPVRRLEELLPLSRQPRIWTTVSSQPYAPDYTKRILSCGTAENTKQVKSVLLRADCEARKSVRTQPDVNEPELLPGWYTRPQFNPVCVRAAQSTPCNSNLENVVGERDTHNLPPTAVAAGRVFAADNGDVTTSPHLVAPTRAQPHAYGLETNKNSNERRTMLSLSTLVDLPPKLNVSGRINKNGVAEHPRVPDVFSVRMSNALANSGARINGSAIAEQPSSHEALSYRVDHTLPNVSARINPNSVVETVHSPDVVSFRTNDIAGPTQTWTNISAVRDAPAARSDRQADRPRNAPHTSAWTSNPSRGGRVQMDTAQVKLRQRPTFGSFLDANVSKPMVY